MATDNKKSILIVEDDQTLRDKIAEWLTFPGWYCVKAEHMEQAQVLIDDRWNEIRLIVMDVMLPKNESDAGRTRELAARREREYQRWLELEEAGASDNDEEWRKTRFAVDEYSRQIFSLVDVEGGVRIIREFLAKRGEEILQKPVLYLTAREDPELCAQGLALVASGRAEWLVKPVSPEEARAAARRLLPGIY
jgi:DNA-binding response OmpR family regulator